MCGLIRVWLGLSRQLQIGPVEIALIALVVVGIECGAEVDLRGAAERAGLPVAVLLEEMAARKVAVLGAPEDFGPGLEVLRRAWPKDE